MFNNHLIVHGYKPRDLNGFGWNYEIPLHSAHMQVSRVDLQCNLMNAHAASLNSTVK